VDGPNESDILLLLSTASKIKSRGHGDTLTISSINQSNKRLGGWIVVTTLLVSSVNSYGKKTFDRRIFSKLLQGNSQQFFFI
jgi:hypothetical protein